jgi:hypothetical protein
MTRLQQTAPPEIWLQISDDPEHYQEEFPKYHEEISWCNESTLSCEVRYVRADLAPPARGDDMTEDDKTLVRQIEWFLANVSDRGDYRWVWMQQAVDAIARLPAPPAQGEPVAFINVSERKLEWNGPQEWNTSTVGVEPRIPLYATAPPVDGFGGNLDEAFGRSDARREIETRVHFLMDHYRLNDGDVLYRVMQEHVLAAIRGTP